MSSIEPPAVSAPLADAYIHNLVQQVQFLELECQYLRAGAASAPCAIPVVSGSGAGMPAVEAPLESYVHGVKEKFAHLEEGYTKQLAAAETHATALSRDLGESQARVESLTVEMVDLRARLEGRDPIGSSIQREIAGKCVGNVVSWSVFILRLRRLGAQCTM
jgi:hypothetical protein